MRELTALIVRHFPGDDEKRRFEDDLAGRLAGLGLPTLVSESLYHLPGDAPAVRAIRAVKGSLLVLSWLKPRAMFWLLRERGVQGRRTAECAEPDEAGGRPIAVFDLHDRCCPGRWAERVGELIGGAGPGRGEVTALAGAAADRWYPVLDLDRCTGCMDCVSFCLFKVYEEDPNGAGPAVIEPDACKPGCPACSRVCPHGAIMFPLYADDEGIAGSDTARIRPFDPAGAARAREDYEAGRASVADVVRACGCKGGGAAAEKKEGPKPEDGDAAYFDGLIDDVIG